MRATKLGFTSLGLFVSAWVIVLGYIFTGNSQRLVFFYRDFNVLMCIFAVGALFGISAMFKASEEKHGKPLATLAFACNAFCLIGPYVLAFLLVSA